MFKKIWLVLNYTLPTAPSRHRVAAWRALKKMGAVNVQQSMWLIPDSEENYKQMADLSREIEESGGTAMLMGSRFFDQEQEDRMCDLFNEKKNAEYREFIAECGKYLSGIERKTRNRRFVDDDLKEEVAEQEKLLKYYEKIAAGDVFMASEGSSAQVQTELIQAALDGYRELVSRHVEEDLYKEDDEMFDKEDWDF